MKRISITPLIFILMSCLVAHSQTKKSSADIQDPIVQKRLINIKARFEQLPADKITAYQDLKQKAIEANQKQKYFTALIAANDALAIFGDDIDLLWLKGVCYAQLNEKEKAVANYKKALAIHPNHAPSLLNIVEIYYYHGDYKQAIYYMVYIRKFLNSVGETPSPLFDFKYLITLTKLVKDQPDEYSSDLEEMQRRYNYMDDNLYYYYAKALSELDKGNKNEGQVWIYKATTVFQNANLIKIWNKALEDSDFLEGHDIVIDSNAKKR